MKDNENKQTPFLAIPGRHITKKEAVEAVGCGLLIGTAILWPSPLIALVQGSIGAAVGMAHTDVMVADSEQRDGKVID